MSPDTYIHQSACNLLHKSNKMLLLQIVIIFQILSTKGGVIKEYPYFSKEITIRAKENIRPLQDVSRPKIRKNPIFTFDPAPDSMKALLEYIWIDHEY